MRVEAEFVSCATSMILDDDTYAMLLLSNLAASGSLSDALSFPRALFVPTCFVGEISPAMRGRPTPRKLFGCSCVSSRHD